MKIWCLLSEKKNAMNKVAYNSFCEAHGFDARGNATVQILRDEHADTVYEWIDMAICADVYGFNKLINHRGRGLVAHTASPLKP
jgi:hypothetical protein